MPRPPLPTAVYELITKKKADEYLAKSTGNRPISKTRVDSLGRMLSTNKWEMTDQGIGFDVDDVLVNGHHRLTAISRFNVSACVLVVRGLSKSAVYAMDIGKPRSMADILGHYIHPGTPNMARLVAVCRAEMRLLSDNPSTMINYTPQEVDAHFARSSLGLAWLQTHLKRKPPAPYYGALLLAWPTCPDGVDDFARMQQQVRDREMVAPRGSLITKLIKAIDRIKGGGSMPSLDISERTLVAIKAHIDGGGVRVVPQEMIVAHFKKKRVRIDALVSAEAAE